MRTGGAYYNEFVSQCLEIIKMNLTEEPNKCVIELQDFDINLVKPEIRCMKYA